VAVLVEAYYFQRRRTWLHDDRLFTLKIAYMFILAAAFLTHSMIVYVILSLLGAGLLLTIRAWRIVYYSLIVYLPPTLIIAGIDYIAGTLTWDVVGILVYGYATFINILLLYSTTPIQQIRDHLGRNPLTLSLLMLHNIVGELNNILESKKARGWEPVWSIYRHSILVFDALRLMIERIDDITVALKARGVD
jgi:hypothetical protein